MIRIGIVGAGGNTTGQHIPKLQALPGVEIISVCNRSHASAERVARQFGIPQICERWQDFTTAHDIHAVIIGTWPYLHCPVTLAALAAGKHVLCEARMAKDATEARTMLAAAQAKPHLITQVVPAPMTLRVDNTIKRLLAEGFVGEVLAVEVRAGGNFLDRDAPLHWRQDFELSGFNTLSVGIWYETVMRWIGEARSVTAKGKTFVKERKDATGALRPVRVPEHLDVIADMACGAQAHFQISAVAGLAGEPEALLFGSAGTLRYAGDKLFGGRRGESVLQEISIPPAEAGRWRVEEEFINAIHGRETVTRTTFADGVRYMEFTEAVARSIANDVTCKVTGGSP